MITDERLKEWLKEGEQKYFWDWDDFHIDQWEDAINTIHNPQVFAYFRPILENIHDIIEELLTLRNQKKALIEDGERLAGEVRHSDYCEFDIYDECTCEVNEVIERHLALLKEME